MATERKFGAALRRRRKELGLSEVALATKTGLPHTCVRAVERGAEKLSYENMVKIAEGLNWSLAELFAVFTR